MQGGAVPLCCAIAAGHQSVVKVLLAAKPDLECTDTCTVSGATLINCRYTQLARLVALGELATDVFV